MVVRSLLFCSGRVGLGVSFVLPTPLRKEICIMRSTASVKVALAACLALSALTSLSTASFAAETHYRAHSHVTARSAHRFVPDAYLPGTAGRPWYNAPGVSRLA